MTTRNYALVLLCDGQQLPPHTVKLDDSALHRRASQQGVQPGNLLARQIRDELARQYTILATDNELLNIAQALLAHGSNQARPLPVAALPNSGAVDAETRRQLDDLHGRLSRFQATLQGERLTHNAERERLEQDLADTRAALRNEEFLRRQTLDEAAKLGGQLRELRGIEAQLQDTQRQRDAVAGERDALVERVERLRDDLKTARTERDQLRDRLSQAEHAHTALSQQQQQLQELFEQTQQMMTRINRLCTLAFDCLISDGHDRNRQLPKELREALDIYKGGVTYGDGL